MNIEWRFFSGCSGCVSLYQNVKPLGVLLQQEVMELAMVTDAAKLRLDHHHQHTNTQSQVLLKHCEFASE